MENHIYNGNVPIIMVYVFVDWTTLIDAVYAAVDDATFGGMVNVTF
jgi:hypothetical protein